MFAAVSNERRYFDDFRENGLLLPCIEEAALRTGLPLHRGPHRSYTELVTERVAQIERSWRAVHCRNSCAAAQEAQMRLNLLRRALRRHLLMASTSRPLLNRHDPLRQAEDFFELDALVDRMWAGTAEASEAPASAA